MMHSFDYSLNFRLSEVNSSVFSRSTQLFLNTEDLVVFCKTLWSAGSSSLDLKCMKIHNQNILRTQLPTPPPKMCWYAKDYTWKVILGDLNPWHATIKMDKNFPKEKSIWELQIRNLNVYEISHSILQTL